MKIKMELELSPDFLIRLQKRADYLNERYNMGTAITVKNLVEMLIFSNNIESIILPEFEEKIKMKNMEVYKEFFN